jgi:hypothetical protein
MGGGWWNRWLFTWIGVWKSKTFFWLVREITYK